VLVYQTEPLSQEISIAGPIIASLQCSTTGTDADWIVKLIDVYPPDAPDDSPRRGDVKMGGCQMLLAGEVFRSKFRNSYDRPEPLKPGQVAKIEFDLRDKHHRFLKGHRIMVQIQSTWFPVIDRNPQQFLDIYRAMASDYRKAEHRVHRSAERCSRLKLRVLAAD
jgi:putative CocE/NonD family hydrolase